MNVTSIIGGQAYFPCTYEGTDVTPGWRIVHANGEASHYTATTLPINHYYNGMGLLVREIDQTLNLTVYSCFFKFNIAGSYRIMSLNGTLKILSPVIFELSIRDDEYPHSFLREGVYRDNFISIVRKTATNLEFVLSLKLESLQGNFTGEII